MPRLFFALWPDAPARRELASLAVRIAHEARGRAVPAAKLHLTLAFLGDVEAGRVGAACRAADGLRGSSFRITLDRVGGFVGSRVGWAGCSEAPPELLRLQASLREALAGEGFAVEKRAFSPHLTLAREVASRVSGGSTAPISWNVAAFSLVETLPRGGGYATRAEWLVGERKN